MANYVLQRSLHLGEFGYLHAGTVFDYDGSSVTFGTVKKAMNLDSAIMTGLVLPQTASQVEYQPPAQAQGSVPKRAVLHQEDSVVGSVRTPAAVQAHTPAPTPTPRQAVIADHQEVGQIRKIRKTGHSQGVTVSTGDPGITMGPVTSSSGDIGFEVPKVTTHTGMSGSDGNVIGRIVDRSSAANASPLQQRTASQQQIQPPQRKRMEVVQEEQRVVAHIGKPIFDKIDVSTVRGNPDDMFNNTLDTRINQLVRLYSVDRDVFDRKMATESSQVRAEVMRIIEEQGLAPVENHDVPVSGDNGTITKVARTRKVAPARAKIVVS